MRTRLLSFCLCAAAFLCLAAPARAEHNAVHFFNNIRVAPDDAVENAVCFFCGVDAEGPVKGNVVVFFGYVRLNSEANQNVVAFFSNVALRPGSSVRQNSVNIFSSLRLGDNVRVEQNAVTIFGSYHAADSASVSGNTVYFPFWIFGVPALLLCVAIFALVREIRERRFRRAWMQGQPLPPRA